MLYPLRMKLQTHRYVASGNFVLLLLPYSGLGMLYSIVMITMSRISYYLTWPVGQLKEPLVLFCLAFYLVDTTGEIKPANFNVLTNTSENASLQLLNLENITSDCT